MPKRKRSRGTLIEDTSGRRAAWRKRLPFIIAFVNGERVECKLEWESYWERLLKSCFGYNVEELMYRIVRNGKTISPAAYMRSLKVNKVDRVNGNGKPKRSVVSSSRFRQFTFD